jgi:two-component system cell cycle sensor histidine kinase/response regulator CckA
MNTYSKILLTTLPLVLFLLMATVGTSYYFSRTALTDLAETWLETRLAEAMHAAADQEEMLRRYSLEEIPASIAKAQLDAGSVMSAIEVGQSGYIFAVDRGGTIASHPDAAMVGRDVSQESWFTALKPGKRQLVHQTPAGRNLAMVDYFDPWQWYILASDPEREVYGVANRMKPYLITLGVIGFLVISIALMLLTRRITAPLRLLTAGAEQIGNGDIETRIAIDSQDEFGRLAVVFNQMAGRLHETLTTLRHREAHFRSLIENSTDLIAVLDANGRIAYLSPSVMRILGYTQEAPMGRRVFEFIHPDDVERALDLFVRRIKSPDIELQSELRLRHENGSWQTLEFNSNDLLDHPAVNGIVINARDITKRKAAEAALQRSHDQLEDRVAERTAELFKANEQLRKEIEERERMSREKDKLQNRLLQAQKMEAIGTLAGGIAHDFNNLLMGIQGNVDIISLDLGPTHAHSSHLQTIRDCVLSGTQLTQQLLGFARLGKYEVIPTNPNELVEKSADMFGRTRQELRIDINLQKDAWTVNVDRGQIQQVLLNLLINAWQAMPDGGAISLETVNEILPAQHPAAHRVSPGKYVRISITDTGIGMDSPTVERIFDPFFTTKAMKRGTGLGLASAYGIIRNHGGFIDVRSEPGHGTTFDIYLKAMEEPVSAPMAKPNAVRKGNETILLVDDDEMILDVGRTMLENLGYTVIAVNGGKAAISEYRNQQQRIDLVVLDMIMPDMDGGKACDQLKTINPGVKVLLSSGYSIDGQASEILDRGCNGFIQKPFDLQALSEKVRVILDASR